MTAVIRRIFFLGVTVLSLNACGSGSDKQWTKAGENYTVAEFQRDQTECTKGKVLDEDCMKDRGWIAISADRDKGPPPMQGGGTPAKPRSAPK